MAWGELTPKMLKTLRPHVANKVVWDLGAGCGNLARALADLGARVTAFDKTAPKNIPKGVNFIVKAFQQFANEETTPDVAFLSWPVNNYNTDALRFLLHRVPVIVYLGCNLEGSACGTRTLFEELKSRELVVHVPHRKNTLMVLGAHLPEGTERDLVLEEQGHWCGKILNWS